MPLLWHRNDCHHPSRLVITMTPRRQQTKCYGHQLTRGGGGDWPLHLTTLLINPINPTGYHLIIILLLIYYMIVPF